jgi:hypothetical protein
MTYPYCTRNVTSHIYTTYNNRTFLLCRNCSNKIVFFEAVCDTDVSIKNYLRILIYEGRLKISWTRLITPSRNFVEVRWRSLHRSTSLGKRCTTYNAPPTSRKRAADRLPRASGGSGTGGFDLSITSRFIFHVRFSVSKALPPLRNCNSSQCVISIGLMNEL